MPLFNTHFSDTEFHNLSQRLNQSIQEVMIKLKEDIHSLTGARLNRDQDTDKLVQSIREVTIRLEEEIYPLAAELQLNIDYIDQGIKMSLQLSQNRINKNYYDSSTKVMIKGYGKLLGFAKDILEIISRLEFDQDMNQGFMTLLNVDFDLYSSRITSSAVSTEDQFQLFDFIRFKKKYTFVPKGLLVFVDRSMIIEPFTPFSPAYAKTLFRVLPIYPSIRRICLKGSKLGRKDAMELIQGLELRPDFIEFVGDFPDDLKEKIDAQASRAYLLSDYYATGAKTKNTLSSKIQDLNKEIAKGISGRIQEINTEIINVLECIADNWTVVTPEALQKIKSKKEDSSVMEKLMLSAPNFKEKVQSLSERAKAINKAITNNSEVPTDPTSADQMMEAHEALFKDCFSIYWDFVEPLSHLSSDLTEIYSIIRESEKDVLVSRVYMNIVSTFATIANKLKVSAEDVILDEKDVLHTLENRLSRDLEAFFIASRAFFSKLIRENALQPQHTYEIATELLLHMIPLVLSFTPFIGSSLSSATHGAIKFFEILGKDETLRFFSQVLNYSDFIPEKLRKYGIDLLNKTTKLILQAMPSRTKDQVKKFHESFRDLHDFHYKKESFISQFLRSYQRPLEKLSNKDIDSTANFLVRQITQLIGEGLLQGEHQHSLTDEDFVSRLMFFLSYAQLEESPTITLDKKTTVTDLLQCSGLSLYRITDNGNKIFNFSGEISLSYTDECKKYHMPVEKKSYVLRPNDLSYRAADPVLVEALKKLDLQHIDPSKPLAIPVNFPENNPLIQLTLTIPAEFLPSLIEAVSFEPIVTKQKTDRQQLLALQGKTAHLEKKVDNLENEIVHNIVQELVTRVVEISQQEEKKQLQEKNQQLTEIITAMTPLMIRPLEQERDKLKETISDLHKKKYKSTGKKKQELASQIDTLKAKLEKVEKELANCKVTAKQPLFRRDHERDGDSDAPSSSQYPTSSSAGARVLSASAKQAPSNSDNTSGNKKHSSTQTKSAAQKGDRLSKLLNLWCELEPEPENALLSTKKRLRVSELASGITKILNKNRPSYPDYLTLMVGESEEKGSSEFLVANAHTIENKKHRIDNLMVVSPDSPSLVKSQGIPAQVHKGFADYYLNQKMDIKHHVLYLQKNIDKATQLYQIMKLIIQERGLLLCSLPPSFPLYRLLNQDWAAFKSRCRRVMKESLLLEGALREEQELLLEDPETYIREKGIERRERLKHLLELHPLEFIELRNQAALKKIEEEGEYAAQHPDTLCGQMHRIGASAEENQKLLVQLKEIRTLKLKEAAHIREKEEAEKNTLAEERQAAQEKPKGDLADLLHSSYCAASTLIPVSNMIHDQKKTAEYNKQAEQEAYLAERQDPRTSTVSYAALTSTALAVGSALFAPSEEFLNQRIKLDVPEEAAPENADAFQSLPPPRPSKRFLFDPETERKDFEVEVLWRVYMLADPPEGIAVASACREQEALLSTGKSAICR